MLQKIKQNLHKVRLARLGANWLQTETKRNCGSYSTDDGTPTVPAILPRPVLASTRKVPETYFKNTIKLIIFHIK
jgi:hypothetical protein